MDINHLFKLIRKEEVGLWIGAGFSNYSGYPNGRQLKEIIFKELTAEEKKSIDKSANLRDIAENLIKFRNNSRNELNQILKRIFGGKPNDTYFHDILSRIPHFRQIITTNYDSLLENSYATRAITIRSDQDVPYIRANTISIHKPHGDLLAIDNLIIAERDYKNFSNIDFGTPFWAAILNIITSKSLLFLAYSFEDENVWEWLDIVDNAVGAHRNERFLIAPNWDNHQIVRLSKKNVKYINLTADVFLNELNLNIKTNIVSDLDNGLVSQNTFNDYIYLNGGYGSRIETNNGKSTLVGLHNPNKQVINTLNVQFTNKKIATQLKNFTQGFGKEVSITQENLSSFEVFTDGFKMNINESTISSFQLIRPLPKQKVEVEFPNEDFILDDLEFEAYRISKTKTNIELIRDGFKIEIIITTIPKKGAQVNASFSVPEKFPSVTKCIQFFKTIVYYVEGKKCLVHWCGNVFDKSARDFECDLPKLKQTLLFFENLKQIEKKYSIKFDGDKIDVSSRAVLTAEKLVELLNNSYLPLSIEQNNSLTIKRQGGFINTDIDVLLKDVDVILFKSGQNATVHLCGHVINLGEYGIEIEQPEITEFSKDRSSAMVRSKCDKYLQRFDSLFKFSEIKNIID
jgi:SIR2-like protein